MQEWISACSTWHSRADSASADASPPVAKAAVSSKSPSVGGFTAGTLGAMMHDCVQWGFTGKRPYKQAQEWQTVLEMVQPKRQNAYDTPSLPLSKFITTEASQGGVIALSTTKITRQHDTVSFSQATACRMDHGLAEKLSPHGKTITNRKGTSQLQHTRNVNSRSCAF